MVPSDEAFGSRTGQPQPPYPTLGVEIAKTIARFHNHFTCYGLSGRVLLQRPPPPTLFRPVGGGGDRLELGQVDRIAAVRGVR